jgi:hypothetical protein
VEGPVWSPHLATLRTFRYEVRRWREGRMPDVAYAVASPQHVSDDVQQARRLLELVPFLPHRVHARTLEVWDEWPP